MLKRIRKRIHPPIFTGWVVMLGLISWGISKETGYSFWALLVGFYGALAIIGFVITMDRDDE
jgi:hypothetical protein